MRENPPTKKLNEVMQGKSYLSNQVFMFDLLEPKFTRLNNMPRGFISLYPAFFDGQENALLLVNEDSFDSEPECLRYHLDTAGLTNGQ